MMTFVSKFMYMYLICCYSKSSFCWPDHGCSQGITPILWFVYISVHSENEDNDDNDDDEQFALSLLKTQGTVYGHLIT